MESDQLNQILPETNQGTSATTNNQGCLTAGLVILGVLWILTATIIYHLVIWSLEQTIFEGSLPVPDVRWVISLVYSLVLFIPLLVATLLLNNSRLKSIFRTWTLAAIPALLLFPAKLLPITDAQAANLAQIVGLVFFIIILVLVTWRTPKMPGDSRSGIGLGISLALILAVPWALWEALGSPLDSILNLLVGLLIGISAALLINRSLEVGPEMTTQFSSGRIALDGLVIALALLIVVSGVCQNGIEWVMAIGIPVLGWSAVMLTMNVREGEQRSRWPAAAALVGLATAWPLIFVDPDELMLVITGDPGDLVSWVIRSLTVVVGLSILILIGLAIFNSRIQKAIPWTGIKRLIPVGALILLAAIFVFAGRPGFYGERIFVILKDQADVSNAATIKDYNTRRATVYNTLTQHATQTQAGIRQSLDRLGIRYKPYYLVNAIEVQAGPFVRLWLSTRPEVDRILDNPILRPLPARLPVSKGPDSAPNAPDWNLRMIHAPQVWQMGITGKNIVIGQSDSGVQGDHPELKDSYRGAGGNNNYNWFDPWYHTSSPVDIGGHGTHTTGTIVGKTVGVAPGATWIACVNLARNLGNPSVYLDCWQFLLAPFPQNGDPFKDGKPELGAQVLNDSWGCPIVEGCDPKTFLPAVKALHSAGIFVVVSAGNSGYGGCGSVEDPPAIYQEVYSVGAINESGNITEFSSLGPVKVDGSNRIKPDIVAPGEGVVSSFPGNTYDSLSGTSMAGPHVVGVVALLWSANPALIGDIDRTRTILDESAAPYSGSVPACVTSKARPNNGSGYGIVDALAAVRLALGQ